MKKLFKHLTVTFLALLLVVINAFPQIILTAYATGTQTIINGKKYTAQFKTRDSSIEYYINVAYNGIIYIDITEHLYQMRVLLYDSNNNMVDTGYHEDKQGRAVGQYFYNYSTYITWRYFDLFSDGYSGDSGYSGRLSYYVDSGRYKLVLERVADPVGNDVTVKYSVTYPDKSSLKPPQNITTESTGTSIKLQWQYDYSASAYRIYMYSTQSKSFKKYKDTTSNFCEISGLKSNKTYYFRIATLTKSNNKYVVLKNTSNIAVKTQNALPAPKNISSKVGSDFIDMSWSEISGASAYRIYIKYPGSDSYKAYKDVTNTSYKITGLKSGTSYSFKIASLVKINGKYKEQAKTSAFTVKTAAKTSSNDSGSSSDTKNSSIDPTFKAAMDSYEVFFKKYCDFMKKYQSNPTDPNLLSDYIDYTKQYADTMKKLEAWKGKDLNDAETAYYLEVSGRITKMLLNTANAM